MKEITASIRELKSRLSHYLRLAKRGQIVEITERGRPVGRIVPVVSPLEDRIEAAIRSGLVSWNRAQTPPSSASGQGPQEQDCGGACLM
jgi:prevent-host-death family protein